MRNSKLTRIISLLIVSVMLLGCICSCADNGKSNDDSNKDTQKKVVVDEPTGTDCFKSEHYTITQDQFKYYFLLDYYDALESYYSSYFYYYGLDPSKNLKEQDFNDDETWFQYFLQITAGNVHNFLIFAEAAKAEGLELGKEEKAKVDTNIKDLEEAAKAENLTVNEFLAYRFGEGVTEDMVRECQALYQYSTQKYEADLAKINITDEEINKYYEENKSDFLFVDYTQVQIAAEVDEDATEEEKAKAFEVARAKAQYIADAKDYEEYVQRSIEYYTSINDTLDTPLTKEQIERKAYNITAQYQYNDKTAFGQWAFKDGRKSGELTMLDNGAGVYTAYYLVSAPYRLENNTKNLRVMLFNPSMYGDDEKATEEAAQKALDAFEKTGKTEDDFVKIASEYSYSNGDVKENIDLGDLGPNGEKWAFVDERKAGDYEKVEDNGVWYIYYFVSDGGVAWEVDARDQLLSKAINDVYLDYMDKYQVTYNEENMNLLSGETLYSIMKEETTSEESSGDVSQTVEDTTAQ